MSRKLSLIIMLSLVIMFIAQPQPAHAAGTAYITAISCAGLTIRGTSNQPWVIAAAMIPDPVAEYVYADHTGLVPVAQDGTFTFDMVFGLDGLASVPSGTTLTILINDYSAPDDSALSSHFELINVSVLCPSADDTPPNFGQVIGACFVPVQAEPNGKQLSSYLIDYAQKLFVNPELKQDNYGKLWAEIFVAKNLMGYIPANCIK